MPVGGPEWDASFAAKGVVTVGIGRQLERIPVFYMGFKIGNTIKNLETPISA